jgi:hypothetical protein
MNSSRRRGLRGGIRALALLAIASSVVVGIATAAEAKQINSVSQLKSSCAKGNGNFVAIEGGVGVCEVKGGAVVCDDNKKGKKCEGFRYSKRGVVPAETVRAPGVTLTTQTVPDSRVWKQTLSVPDLGDVVCPSLGGRFVASADATLGACGTPTATIFCKYTIGRYSCVGVANTEKQAKSIPKEIKTVVSGNAGGTPSTTGASPTTNTSTPLPTRPPGTKGVPPSVSVAPAK